MRYIKKFEKWTPDEEIYLDKDIYADSPSKRGLDFAFVIKKLTDKLKGKVITFINASTRTIKKGKVLKVEYDNDKGNRISYVNVDCVWYDIEPSESIIIHNVESDAEKYNL